MARRPYVPSGNSDPGALPIVLGATLAAGVAAGVVDGIASRWFSLLLVFPLILGAAVGGVGGALVRSRRVRSPAAVALICFAAGALSQAMVHVVRYQHARTLAAEVLAANEVAAAYARRHGDDAAVDLAFTRGEGGPAFLGYLQVAAERGITISHNGSVGPTLTGNLAYALWILELLVAAGFAAWTAASHAREPFCERCSAWYDTQRVVLAGGGGPGRVKDLVRLLESGDLAGAARAMGESDGTSRGALVVRGCSRCQDHEPLLELHQTTHIGKEREVTKKVYASLVTPAEARDLQASAEDLDAA